MRHGELVCSHASATPPTKIGSTSSSSAIRAAGLGTASGRVSSKPVEDVAAATPSMSASTPAGAVSGIDQRAAAYQHAAATTTMVRPDSRLAPTRTRRPGPSRRARPASTPSVASTIDTTGSRCPTTRASSMLVPHGPSSTPSGTNTIAGARTGGRPSATLVRSRRARRPRLIEAPRRPA